MAGHLSTHVLDTERGVPAAGVWVSLYRVNASGADALARTRTDDDGRIARVMDEPLAAGTYRLEFAVGDYQRARGADAPFLEALAVTFAITDPARGYHVPLLLAPYGCTTYRGS
jgi:5-hydroxyisourate hydrolase